MNSPAIYVLSRVPQIGLLSTVVFMLLSSCDAPERTASPNDPLHPVGIMRTADPAKRGLSESDFPRIQELASDVYSYEQLRSSGDERFTTVSLFVVTDEGVLVADGQGSLVETQRMVDEIGKITPQPITHVVICSDHGDHTAGNQAFPNQALFFAHPTSQQALQGQARRQTEAGETPRVVLATELVEAEKTIHLGGKTLQILFLGRAHTGGDLTVYLPDQKILFMSEAYLNRIFPAMRSAYPSEWEKMIRRAQAMDVEIYVPGHGFVESPQILQEELETFRKALETVIAEAQRLHQMGLSAEEAAEQADFGELESWSLHSSQATRAIARVYRELNGELLGSVASRPNPESQAPNNK